MLPTVIGVAQDQTEERAKPPSRLYELDGLRGWAALCVVAFHMLWETFGSIHPIIRNVFTAVILDSSVAVSVFFVLSGEALSSAFFGGGKKNATMKLAIKRYPRLVIPILATSIIIYIIVHVGANPNHSAAVIVKREDWLGIAPPKDLSLSAVLKYSLLSVFLSEFPSGVIDIFLWTMRMELFGSLIVFFILSIWQFLPRPRFLLCVLYIALAVAPSATAGQLSCFLAGMLFADLRRQGVFERVQARIGDKVLWCSIVTLAILDGIVFSRHIHVSSAWLASVFLLLVFCSRSATSIFSSSFSRWLGSISFPLHLMQFPVLISFTSWAIVFTSKRHQMGLTTCLLIAFSSIGVSLIAARGFRPVELFTKWACNKLAVWAMPYLGNDLPTP